MNDSRSARHITGRTLKVLVVDDEVGLLDSLSAAFTYQGWEVEAAATGQAAIQVCRDWAPDVVVLDVGLPDLDGFAVLDRIRAINPGIGVIFLTARDALEDRLTGLRQGGDDYITKPFSLEEILARAEALVRRSGMSARTQGDQIVVDDLVIDTATFEVERAGRQIKLTATEFGVARYLAENARRVCSKQELLREVWGEDFSGGDHVVELYISYLRKKIDAEGPSLIHTVRGLGYVMRAG